MTTIRRLLATTLLCGALALPGAAAAVAADPGPDGVDGVDGVDVSVTISDRTVPDAARVVVQGERPFVVGGGLSVQMTDFAPDTEYEVLLHSNPAQLGTVTTDAEGDAQLAATIPQSTDPGTHTVGVVSATGAEVRSDPFQVEAAAAAPGAGTAAPGTDDAAAPTPGGLATTGAGLGALAALAAVAVGAGALLRRGVTRRAAPRH